MEDKWRTTLFTAVAPAAWGSSYYVTAHFLPPDRPFFAAAVRALPVGLVMLAFTRQLPRGAWWWKALVLGTLNIGAFFPLIFVAGYHLPGGMAATLTATSPIAVMLIAWALVSERPALLSLLGAAVGIAGVALLVLDGGLSLDWVGVAASLGAVAISSLGYVLVRRWQPPVDMLTFSAWQLIAGGLMLVPVAAVVEGAPPTLDTRAIGGFLYICVIGTALAYVAWFNGLKRMPAGAVSLIGLVNPVTGTLLGVALAGEAFGALQLVGMALVLGGVLAGQPAVQELVSAHLHADRVGLGVGVGVDDPELVDAGATGLHER
ncbi:EamA family transporter [Nocardioides sp.]|uniref:EamA family transporter n=1 Tax=Nocardioides sp. TaxID=35761 RepID=UPI003D0969C1